MKIQDLASKFSVLLLSTDLDQGAAIKVALSRMGYEAFFISDMEVGLQSIRESSPHIVILDVNSLPEKLSQFIEKVLSVSVEIRLILIGAEKDFGVLAEYEEHGVNQILSASSPQIERRVVWAVNRICESLYLLYQNEELLSQVTQIKEDYARLSGQQTEKLRQGATYKNMETLIKSYKTCETKEQVINLFFEQMEGAKVLFFKHLPTVHSLLVTHSAGYSQEDVQGIGCQLQSHEHKDLTGQLTLGVCPGPLALLLSRALALSEPRVFPLFSQNELEGVIVLEAEIEGETYRHVSEQFSLFSLAYEYFSLEKKIQFVDTQDSVTGVFNAKYFTKRLGEEVQRARRQKYPLAVVKTAVDDIDEITQTLGSGVRDHVLKMVAQLMVKSSRAHDFVARLKDNELVLVLVNCSKRGAGFRGDRLRRAVESSSVLDHGIKLSVSIGVSEFPSLCDSAQDLDDTSSQALLHIYNKGGNRLCLYKAASNYRPEFEVTEVSGEPNVS